jgi:hypothetical protein
MRRRLIRLVTMAVVVPAVTRGAAMAADRLESANGPTRASRSLRLAGNLAARANRSRRPR